VTELLREQEPLTIINGQMIPALDRVGKGFENGTVFLPQLLMSAEAAKAAFEVIKEKMAAGGVAQEKKRNDHPGYGQRRYSRYRKKYRQGTPGKLRL
jgi:cobalamin-dependent methionine synthase I